MKTLKPNKGKKLEIKIGKRKFARFPVQTHVITVKDNIYEICKKYAKPFLKEGDFLFISERIVAISQGRAYPISEIKPSFLAKFLSGLVHKSPYGIGLGSPWTMELALREAGILRISLGILVSAITKPFGIRGMFYRVVGKNINAIDGPCEYTLPPYNKYAKLGPKDPDKVAGKLKKNLGNDVVIIDANDLGVAILGRSSKDITEDFCKKAFSDNPLGQTSERTPLCVVREIKWKKS